MKIEFSLKDRHGIEIELNQRVALRVHRRSGNYSNWWQRVNENHFNYWWMPGQFVLYTHPNNSFEVNFKPDEASKKALEQPMGKEKCEQNVDYININIFDPLNLDTINIPVSGQFWRAE